MSDEAIGGKHHETTDPEPFYHTPRYVVGGYSAQYRPCRCAGLFYLPVLRHLPPRDDLQPQVQHLTRHSRGADGDGHDRHRQQHRAVSRYGGRPVHCAFPYRGEGPHGHGVHVLGADHGHPAGRGAVRHCRGGSSGHCGDPLWADLREVPQPQRLPAGAPL